MSFCGFNWCLYIEDIQALLSRWGNLKRNWDPRGRRVSWFGRGPSLPFEIFWSLGSKAAGNTIGRAGLGCTCLLHTRAGINKNCSCCRPVPRSKRLRADCGVGCWWASCHTPTLRMAGSSSSFKSQLKCSLPSSGSLLPHLCRLFLVILCVVSYFPSLHLSQFAIILFIYFLVLLVPIWTARLKRTEISLHWSPLCS